MAQSKLALEALARRHPEHDFVLQAVETLGDRRQSLPLTDSPQEGVFVKELEQALLDGRAELAVHSTKDLPTQETRGLTLAAFLPRADARDVLVSREGKTLAGLPSGARVGTGSPRRVAQLLAQRPDVQPVPIRGNVDTRLTRVRDGTVDAVILAAAGVERLGRLDEVHEFLAYEAMLPAPGQGALALQARAGSEAEAVARTVDDLSTRRAVEAERAVLRGLGGGCLSAIGAHGAVDRNALNLQAVVLAEDGGRVVRASARGEADAKVVADVVAQLRAQGAVGLLGEDRADTGALRGVRIMVTRADQQAAGLTRMLEARGARVVLCPVIVIEPLPVDRPRVEGLDEYDWVVFTSANGVERFFQILVEAGLEFPRRAKVAAIGPETAARLRQHGVEAAVVPERFVAEDLVDAMPAGVGPGTRVLLPRAAGSRDVLPDRLRAQGAQVDIIETYRAATPPRLSQELPAKLGEVDIVTFTSSSTVRNFMAALASAAIPVRPQVACIGPITAATARELGLRVDIIAQEYTARGLVDALARHHTSIRT